MGRKIRYITKKRGDIICKAYNDGVSIDIICKKYGIYPSKLYILLDRRGVKARSLSYKTNTYYDRVVKMWDERKMLKEICAEFGLSMATVSRIIFTEKSRRAYAEQKIGLISRDNDQRNEMTYYYTPDEWNRRYDYEGLLNEIKK